VIAVGEGVTHIRPGQLAVGNPGSGCGECYFCRRGREHVPPVISEVVPVAGTPDAFERLARDKDALRKIVVSPDA
jgi:Zn-dependent alcohol dehydrogenase